MSERGFVLKDGPKSYWRVLKSLLVEPRRFYGKLVLHEGYQRPLGFLIISGLLYFIMQLAVASPHEAVGSLFVLILGFLIAPCSLMLICQHVFDARGSYEGTLTVCAYAGAVLTVAWIPFVGVLGFLYSFFLVFLGIQRVYEIEPTKAAVATLATIVAAGSIIVFAFDVRFG